MKHIPHMGFALGRQVQFPQPKLNWSWLHLANQRVAPTRQYIIVKPRLVYSRSRMARGQSLSFILCCQRFHKESQSVWEFPTVGGKIARHSVQRLSWGIAP